MMLRGTRSALALSLALLALLGACTDQAIPGQARASVELDPTMVAGLPVTQGPSGPRQGVATAKLHVDGYSGTPTDQLAVNAVEDLSTFWAQAMPRDFGKRFTPVHRLTSFDSNGANVQVCGQNSQGVQNAFYCPTDDSLSWDRGTMLPELERMFGPMAVVTVFAREMGRAVQSRLGSPWGTSTIVGQQQADCYAGAFIRWVAGGHAAHFQVSTGDGLNAVLSTMTVVRDQVGATVDPLADGSSFDRVTAFQFGFTDGPARCAKIDDNEIRQRVNGLGFTQASQANGNLPVDDTTLGLLEQSLTGAFRQNTTTPPTIVDGNATCADGTGTAPASYCPADNTIAVDLGSLNQLATLPPNDQLGRGTPGLGDFAAFAEVASRFALAVQHAAHLPMDDKNAGLRTACLTGAWAGVIRHRISTGPTQQLLLGPDDLDEAVAELLAPTSMIAADVHGNRVPAGFARVTSFQDGFLQGSTVCTRQFG
jgi:predicted metalloprotease